MFHSPSIWQWPNRLLLTGVLSNLLLLTLLATCLAQVPTHIISDGTLGTEVNRSSSIYSITGGTRPGGDQNLFHSFGQFNVGTDDTARFASDPGVDNIISRVTGGMESMIDGTLQADANLFLLNPHGVMFGLNAALNINGSFHASTADVLRLEDGSEFSTNLSANSTLTVAAPAAFGFLHANPAGITIEGSMLEVPEGETLSVVGGDIEIVGSPSTSLETPSLDAQNGQLNIASVASAGEVVFNPPEQTLPLNVDSFERLGEINVSQGAFIHTSGEGGGTVFIRSGKLVLDNTIIAAATLGNEDGGGVDVEVKELVLTDGAQIRTNTTGSGRGGNLTIKATESISISGSDSEGNSSALFSNTFARGDSGRVSISTPILVIDSGPIQSGVSSEGTGNAGGITVEVGSLELKNGARIDGNSFGAGHGGDLTITATESISISGRDSGLVSNARGEGEDAGNAGDLFISVPILTMDDGRVEALTRGDGNAGTIEISVRRFELTGGAQLSASNGVQDAMGNVLASSGQGGNLTVTATESILIAGQSSNGFQSGIFNNSNANGDGGLISISTPLLTMDDGGRIVTRTLGGADAGNIEIQVGQLELKGGSQIFSGTGDARSDGRVLGIEDGTGRGGSITVIASESIFITGRDSNGFRSDISAGTQIGMGDAGDVLISAPLLTIDDGGIVSSNTSGDGNAGDVEVRVARLVIAGGGAIAGNSIGGSGQGGNMTIAATDSVLITGRGATGISGIFSVAGGIGREEGGGGGSIVITAPLLAMDDGRILARSLGQGDAGDIAVNVERLELKGGAQIFSGIGTAEIIDGEVVVIGGGPGRGGNITITASESIFITGRDPNGFSSAIAAAAQIGTGDAGDVLISTPRLEMQGGNIDTPSRRESSGDAGNLTVEVGVLILRDGAQISSSTVVSGQGGTITITATDSIDIAGPDPDGRLSGVFTDTEGQGQGGDIMMRSPQIQLTDRATISAESSGEGDAGSLRISAGDVALRGDSTMTTTVGKGEGSGGNILIGGALRDDGAITQGVETLKLDGSRITANTDTGGGANIIIGAKHLVLDGASAITANTGNGVGGNIIVAGGVTAGGEITTRAQTVVLRGSKTIANADQGTGGRIDIVTEAFLSDPASEVNASSQEGGIDGEVSIEAARTNLSDLVSPLSQHFAQDTTLLRNRCASRLREGTVSSLVERSREEVSLSPDSILPRRLDRLTSGDADVTNGSAFPSRSQPSRLRLTSLKRDVLGMRRSRVDPENLPDTNCHR